MNDVTDLAAFLKSRWRKECRDAEHFHELSCAAPSRAAHRSCRCRCPARLQHQLRINDRILRDCIQRIDHERASGGWPLDSATAFQTMKALALPYELHPAWRDTWYPGEPWL
ncbi:hypothetical protein GCM10010277_69450 [Streptomyces longisporoflavus]|uniref:DUF6221 family protein n=1 Tax=Streptomyces longisporoflavus TaxID=28044 RepID=UPI00167D386F|nr:DUF6221 family protein [Streptomyces longisporoflavus]GGV63350.1 hypothetical protein GCM10010277_69450 [Streptomyces longisporoflavus]